MTFINSTIVNKINFQQFDIQCLCSHRNLERLYISINITPQSFLSVSRNNVMNKESSRKNDKLNFFITISDSLQSS